jgi:hypothetical protein
MGRYLSVRFATFQGKDRCFSAKSFEGVARGVRELYGWFAPAILR